MGKLTRRTYDITLRGPLEGFHVTMAGMRGRELIAMRKGTMDEADMIELIAARTIKHDFEDDILDLEPEHYEALVEQWGEAIAEGALPPTNGERSQSPSERSPSPTPSRRKSRSRT